MMLFVLLSYRTAPSPMETTSAESVESAAAEAPAAEAARVQASPSAKTLRPGLPAAEAVSAEMVFTETIAKSAERIRPAERIVRSRPRVGGRPMFSPGIAFTRGWELHHIPLLPLQETADVDHMSELEAVHGYRLFP